jgi:fibronectin-binding autotransporter adhesin
MPSRLLRKLFSRTPQRANAERERLRRATASQNRKMWFEPLEERRVLTTDISLSSGNLIVTDIAGGNTNDTLTISLAGSNVRLSDANNALSAGSGAFQLDANTVEVPLASIIGNIQINALAGDDLFTLDLSGGDFIPAGGLSYAGGDPATNPGDRLVITGGDQGTVAYNHSSASDGSIDLSNFGTVSYTGLESITNSGTAADAVFNLPATASDVVLENNGASGDSLSQLRSSGGTFVSVVFANPTGALAINRGDEADTLTVNALPDFTASLAIGSSVAPFAAVTFAGALTLAANKDLTGDASGSISLSAATSDLIVSGTGAVTLTTARNIALAAGSSISTVDGGIMLTANQQGTSATGTFVGIDVNAATIVASGSGNIQLSGRGGDTGNDNIGVRVWNGGSVSSVGNDVSAATISITGVGNGAHSNAGVEVSGTTSIVTSVRGDIALLGTSQATGNGARGVQVVNGGSVTSTGSGVNAADISLTGTGGSIGSSGIGVFLFGSTSAVTAVDGNISFDGTAPGSYGVLVTAANVETTGTGSISLKGTANSFDAHLYLASTATIHTADAPIDFRGDRMEFFSAATINAGAGVVTLRPLTSGKAIDLGGADTASALGLSDAELDQITAGTLRIGDSNSGAITVSAQVSPQNTNVLHLISNATVTAAAAGISETKLAIEATGNVNFTSPSTDITNGVAIVSSSGDINFTNGGGSFTDTVDGVDRIEATNGSVHLTSLSGPIFINNTAADHELLAKTGVTFSLPSVNARLEMFGGASILNTASGGVSITADDVNFHGGTITASGQLISLRPETAGVEIDLGSIGSDFDGVFELSDFEFNQLDAAAINIGGGSSGPIRFSANLSRDALSTAEINLLAGPDQDIALGTFSLDAGGGDILLLTSGVGGITTGDHVGADLLGDGIAIMGSTGAIGSVSHPLRLAANTIATSNEGNNGQNLFAIDSVAIGGGMNSGSGTVGLHGGTFTLSGSDRILDTTSVAVLAGATLAIGGFDETIATLVVSGGAVTGTTGVLTITNEVDAREGSVSAILAGTIGLSKTTSGTLVLSGANTYSGDTTVSAGSLVVNGSLAAGSSVIVNSGGTLGGSGTIDGSVTVNSGGTLAPGNSPGILSVADVTFSAGSTFAVELTGAAISGIDYDQLAVSGNLLLNEAMLDLAVGFAPNAGDRFVIVSKSGTESVSSRFQGLLNGEIVSAAGYAFQISYEGGDGNDIELTTVDLAGRSLSFLTASSPISESAGNYEVTVELSSPAGIDLAIPVTLGGTAVAGTDYENFPAELFFPAGGTQATLVLPIRDDVRFEGQETLTISLQAFGGITVGNIDTHTVTIADNDPEPRLQFASFSQEGAEGTTVMLAVLLLGESELDVTVPLNYAGSAGVSDYSGPASVTIPAGGRFVSVPLTIEDDTTGEGAELIVISLGIPTNAILANDVGSPLTQIITIPQNDAPTVAFRDSYFSVDESVGQRTVIVELSNPAAEEIVIPFLIEGTADSGDRTVLTNSPLVIAPGEISATILVNISDDNVHEAGADELIELRLETPVGTTAILGGTQRHTIQIVDDDIPQAYISALSDTNPWENAGTETFTVRLTKPSTETITVPITISGSGDVAAGTAARGSGKDFTASTASIVFEPGVTSVTRTITIINDTANEPTEKIEITLKEPTGEAVLSKSKSRPITRTMVIRDNDPLVTVKADDTTIKELEPTASNRDFNFIVSLSAPTNVDVTVPLSYGGTATRNSDYSVNASPVGSVTIPAGQTSKKIDINIINDSLDEFEESIVLKLKEPAGEAKLGKAISDSVNITDDDAPPSVRWVTTASMERTESWSTHTMRVELSKISAKDVYVDFILARSPNVVLGGDFNVSLAQNKRLTIPAGSGSATFTISIIDDLQVEPHEGIQFYMNAAVNATLPAEAARSRFFWILNNDAPSAGSAVSYYPNPSSSNAFTSHGSLAITTGIEAATGDFATALSIGGSSNSGGVAYPINSGSSGGVNNPFTLAISGASSGGLYSGSTVFFDANLNGVLDFLDLNGNGTNDEGDLEEPSSRTALDGAFSILLTTEFDVNADGEIDPSEGRLVMVGGTDTSIDLPAVTRLSAPLGQTIITPLSTVVEALMRLEELTYAEATQRVADGFALGNASFVEAHPVHGALGEDTLATAAERASVKLSSAVIQIARLFAGTAGAPPLDYLADAVYAEVAHRLAEEGSELNLSVRAVVADLIGGVSVRTGVLLDADPAIHTAIAEGAAEVIVAGNQRMDAISNTGDVAFLNSLFKIKKVMQADAAPALQTVTAGTETLANVVSNFTGSNLDSRVGAVTLGQLIPPALFINHGRVVEGNDGQRMLELTVDLVGDHSLPVLVDFATQDGTATLADGDYAAVSDTLSWSAGDNSTRTIQIPVHGDAQFETDEQFFMFLSNATNAVIRRGIGYGFILNDETLDTTPSATGDETLHTVRLDATTFSLLANSSFTQQGDLADPLVATVRGTDNVNDTFKLDLASNQFRADVVSFVGGGGTGFDSVEVYGGNFQTITQKLINTTDGQTLFAAEDQPTVTLNWAGMEPFLLNVGSVEHLIFEIPAGVSDAILEDADPADTTPGLIGMMRLRSVSGAFEETIFPNPSGSITLRVFAANAVTIGTLDPAFAGNVVVDILNNDPSITSADTVSVPENSTAVLTVLASDPEAPPQSITFSISGGADGNLFSITPAGVLTFVSAPDFEARADADLDNEYFVEVMASDGVGGSATQTIRVTVTDVFHFVSLEKIGNAAEGGSAATFRVHLEQANSTDLTVSYTGDGTAIPGSDYVALLGTFVIPQGSLSADISIVATNDSVVEALETLILTLNGVTGDPDFVLSATPSELSATATITSDDTATLSISAPTITETDTDQIVTFTVSIDAAVQGGFSVAFSDLLTGTATVGSDYVVTTLSPLVFAGTAFESHTISVTIKGDTNVETSETFTLQLGNVTGTSAEQNSSITTGAEATATIQDNDSATVSIVGTADGLEPATSGKFTVTQSNPGVSDTIVSYIVQPTSTAVAGVDFVMLSGTVTIPAGMTSVDINLAILNDFYAEGTETVIVTLTGITSVEPNVSLAAASDSLTATVDILDDDVLATIPADGTTSLLLDPANPGKFMLVVVGTSKKDSLIVEPASSTAIRVKRNGKAIGIPAANGEISRIVMFGREGNDTLTVHSGLNIVAQLFGEGGNDTLNGGGGHDTLDGGSGNDKLKGNGGDDLMRGGEGNDQLFGGAGEDELRGGIGNDVINGEAGNDSLHGEAGNDTQSGGDGNDTLKGGDGNDTLKGDAGNDSLEGGIGNDTLFGGAGADSLDGGDGNDVLYGDNTTETRSDGADQLSGGSGNDAMYGGGGADFINGGLENDYAFGGTGNDTLNGEEGDDRLYGGDGDDMLWGGIGDDLLSGGNGNDQQYGQAGNDVLIGGVGIDFLFGDEDNDLLFDGSVRYYASPVNGTDASKTVNDAHDRAMLALLNAWKVNAVNFNRLTRTHDKQQDTLSGGSGTDSASPGLTDLGDWELLRP